jgi:asparagine synthase (glutamine-hydrolysing)
MADDARIQFQGCGILGHFGSVAKTEISYRKFCHALNLISHRGPNEEGFWRDLQLQLGHKRFALMDQTDNFAQPRETDKSIFCYNGEIYNTRALAELLPGLHDC